MRIDVLLVNDRAVLRAGLRAVLGTESDLNVVGEAEDFEEGIRCTRELCPDVVIMDIDDHRQEPLRAVRSLLSECPEVRVLILTAHDDDAVLRSALEAGVSGYVPERASTSEICNAVLAVAAGYLYIHPFLMRALLGGRRQADHDAGAGILLTSREVEVLRLIAEGCTNRQAAERLCVSVRTIETHRANLRSKLGLSSRLELTRYAERCGLLTSRADRR